MKLSVGQRILCHLAGGTHLTEQTIETFLLPLEIEGATVVPIRLESGRTILPSWVYAAVTFGGAS